MEEETGKEIIFESWLYKFSGAHKHRISLSYTGTWNKRYFILERDGELPSLLYFTKKPTHDKAVPKGYLKLSSLYRVEKRPAMKGKPFVCRIMTESKQLVLATEDEKIFHLLVFFMQTQIKIKDELEGECFVVRPDNTDDQRCIGARGNMSLLHVSKSGITLALQLSKCVLSQWPLKCIKFYESTGMGQFGFETGRQSPSGEGKYFFNTRHGQDNQIYDLLDRYVMEADAFKQIAASRLTISAERSSVMADLDQLQDVTWVCSDARFMVHLKRISRDIYDNLAVHLGGSRSALSRNQSDPDLLNDTLSHGQAAAQHDRSCNVQDVSCASSHIHDHSVSDLSVRVPPPSTPPSEHYIAGGATSRPPLMKKISIDSQYLHIADSCTISSFGSASPDRYVNANMAAPPTFYEVMKSCNASVDVDTAPPSGAQSHRRILSRQQSRSCEELGAYQKMDADAAPMSYENQTFVKSDESAQFVDGVYSYASPLGARGSCFPSVSNRSAVTLRVPQQGELLKSSRTSMSHPNLVESVDLSESAFASPQRDGPHRPSPLNFKLINAHHGANGKCDDRFANAHSGTNAASSMPTVTPSPKSALSSVISPEFLKGGGFTDKSRSFVKCQTEVTASPHAAAGDSQEGTATLRKMEGRQLPTIPVPVVKETSC